MTLRLSYPSSVQQCRPGGLSASGMLGRAGLSRQADNLLRRRVTGTLCLITFLGYSSQIFLIWPWFGKVLSVDLLKLLLPFKWVPAVLSEYWGLLTVQPASFLLGMAYWNYYLCVTTPPGSVPPGWVRAPVPSARPRFTLSALPDRGRNQTLLLSKLSKSSDLITARASARHVSTISHLGRTIAGSARVAL